MPVQLRNTGPLISLRADHCCNETRWGKIRFKTWLGNPELLLAVRRDRTCPSYMMIRPQREHNLKAPQLQLQDLEAQLIRQGTSNLSKTWSKEQEQEEEEGEANAI